MSHPIQLPKYMGCLVEFYTSLTQFYTKMSFKILFSNRPCIMQSFSRAINLKIVHKNVRGVQLTDLFGYFHVFQAVEHIRNSLRMITLKKENFEK
jgi:hypothetical protein